MIELAPQVERNMTYDEAVLYCQFCDHNGHLDWRLPTEDEYNESACGYWSWHEGRRSKNIKAWWVTPVRVSTFIERLYDRNTIK